MDFRRIFQEDELRNEVPWNTIPVTPSKPIPTRPKPIDRQGNQQQGIPNWFESVAFPAEFFQESQSSNGVTASQNPMVFVDQNSGVSNWEEDFSAKPRGFSDLLNSYGQLLSDTGNGSNNMGYTDLLALTGLNSEVSGSVTQMGSYNGAAASSSSLPISHSQIDNGLQNSTANGMHLFDQNFPMDSNLWNNNYSQSQHIPQYGFPVPYRPSYDLDSSSRTLSNMVSNGSMSFHLAPVTPDHRNRAQEKQLSEIGNVCQEERSYLEKNMQQEAVVQIGNNGVELQCEESLLQSVVESSLAAVSTPFKENHVLDKAGENGFDLNDQKKENGIDLNKTPQQKPKRRKIRPRVVVEGKPKKTPKSTVKKNPNVEKTSVKRKYVRKNGIKPSNAPLVDVVEEVIDDQVAVKSCKRTLDFNLEEDARDECHVPTQDQQEGLLHSIVDSSSSRSTCNYDSDTPAQDICTGINGSSRTQSSMQFPEGLEVVENSPTGIPFDLNCSLTQILDDCMSMPKKAAPSTPPLTRQDPPREDLDVLSSNRYNMGRAGPYQSSGVKYCPPELQIFHPNETSCTLFQTRNTNGNPLRENLNVLASSNVYNMGIAGPCQNSGKEGWTPRLQLLHQNETSCRVFQTSNTHGNHEIAVPYIFQRGTRPMSQNNTNCNSHVMLAEGEQARGSKRGYYHTINEAHVNSMNLIGSHYNSLQVYQEMLQRNQYQRNNCSADLQVPEAYKKTRTENNHNTVNSSEYSSVPSVLHGAREAMGCRQNYANTSPLTSHTNNGGMTPQYGYTNVIRNLQNGSGSSVPNEYSQAMANLHKQVQTIAELHAHNDNLSKEAIDKLKASNLALTSGRAYKGNKKPEGSTQTSELTSLAETVDWSPTTPAKMAKIKGDRQCSKTIPGPQNYTEVLAVKKQTKTARRKRGKTGLNLVNSVAYNTENNERLHRQEAAVYNFHPNVKSRGPLQLAWLPNDPIDEIVRRLTCLNINDGSNMTSIQEKNALVPYGGDGQMVPYDPIKKKLPRPKVDLDPETDRVWKLLMGPAGNGVEGTNEDKEKRWEEERRVFRGRADSFIARMHLIQGDRRFTKWKGSVLDSVIGVFLTQNVSDHLSSSAFISLAARFPLKSTSGSETHYKERIDILVKEPDVCIIDSDDTIVWQEAISSRQVCDQGSFSLHEAEPVEERGETGKRDESFGINAAGHTSLVDNLKSIDDKVVEPNSREQMQSSDKAPSGTTVNVSKSKGRIEKGKKEAFDWDSLRKEVNQKGLKREESKNTMDSLDWEAVRCADVGEIAKAIKERGMNNMLAERIKDLLNRLVKEHGSINLEWLRDVPPDKAKEYLLSIRGLGLKSVECVRLLTLHHLAFPVDTNVGRIAVRLGWVPLQPLPESLQLHLLEMYPILETIQKYLWPRLCTLDQPTLYELHYQLITFGKVFCTKSKPNCNACPMRAECKHFASAFASARLALPGPEEKGIVTSFSPIPNNQNPSVSTKTVPVPLLEADPLSQSRFQKDCEPIVEEPATPENECIEIAESDIEDAIYECPNEIPSIDLNFEEFTLNLQNYMQENNMELQEGEVSKALVAITPQAASIPIPKLKNVNRLRTEHHVYELPDSHPLLEEVPRRDPDDHVSYLLAIWTPGETAESIQPPERCCGSQASGNLCDDKTCFSCNSIREANTQTVRGTLLIPCKTAMRGSFPLNGTYFQVNEVFADHASSLNPIDVPRAWIWNLPRRTVLFGTSIPTIFKGQSTQEIQNCFWKGYVCVRGFDQKLRIPRPLMARLHFPASKLAKNKTDMHKE